MMAYVIYGRWRYAASEGYATVITTLRHTHATAIDTPASHTHDTLP